MTIIFQEIGFGIGFSIFTARLLVIGMYHEDYQALNLSLVRSLSVTSYLAPIDLYLDAVTS